MLKSKALYYIIPVVTGVSAITVGIIASKYSKSLDNDESSTTSSSIETIDDYNDSLSEDAIRMNTKISLIYKYLFGQAQGTEGLDINGDMRINVLDLVYMKKNRLALETAPTTNISSETTQSTTDTSAIPVTQPPVTQPPVIQPPVTQPPVIQPPATQPPAPQPPATQPPAPPVTEPPAPQPPATQPPAPSGVSEYQAEVLRLVNVERAKAGLSALEADLTLMQASQIRADEIIQSFSHTRPNGTSCFTVLSELGISYRSCGENIAAGYPTLEQTVNQWMNSQGHRENILNSSYTHLGVGYVNRSGTQYGNYWVQLFVGR
ncbi:MAG TPA: hypothetical protein GX710_04680 [Clostridiales bacterium]|nr:hypothetical protein [Clostridiales bacterium]